MPQLLSQIPNPDDVVIPEPDSTTQPHPSGDSASATNQRFGNLVGDAEIKAAQEMAVPANTKKEHIMGCKDLERSMPYAPINVSLRISSRCFQMC